MIDEVVDWQKWFEHWLNDSAASTTRQMLPNGVCVLASCDSTQDECMLIGKPGQCCITLRQNKGRGRLGRRWHDAQGTGIMLTVSLPIKPATSEQPNQNGQIERLSIQAGIACARAAEQTYQESEDPHPCRNLKCGIRWPNDVMIQGRKLAGILIETRNELAYIGIGMNVGLNQWPQDLAQTAVCLQELSKTPIKKRNVIARILAALAEGNQCDDSELTAEFAARDILQGRTCTFEVGKNRIRGVVERIDPMQGLLIRETEILAKRKSTALNPITGELKHTFLPASITSLCAVDDELKT